MIKNLRTGHKKAIEHSEFIQKTRIKRKARVHTRELGHQQTQRCYTKVTIESLFHIKGNEYSLNGFRFQREQVEVFLEFRPAPLSDWVEGFWAIFGSHWIVVAQGGTIFYFE